MKVLMIQDDLFGYLQHVVQAYAGSGINPEEGMAIYMLNQAIKSARNVDEKQVAKVTTGEVGDTPVAAVSVTAEE